MRLVLHIDLSGYPIAFGFKCFPQILRKVPLMWQTRWELDDKLIWSFSCRLCEVVWISCEIACLQLSYQFTLDKRRFIKKGITRGRCWATRNPLKKSRGARKTPFKILLLALLPFVFFCPRRSKMQVELKNNFGAALKRCCFHSSSYVHQKVYKEFLI
jgi:hypothetical protein